MKSMKCPNCGAQLEIDDDSKQFTCKYCRASYIDDDGTYSKVKSNRKIRKTFTLDRKAHKNLIIVVVTFVLIFAIGAGAFLTNAWLKTSETVTNDIEVDEEEVPSTHLGEVDVEILSNGVSVGRGALDSPITITISGASATRAINLKVRNAGTVDALVRADIDIYYLDANSQKVSYILTNSPVNDGECRMTNAGWVNNLAASNVVATGQTFYNSLLQPYTVKTLVNGEVTTTTYSARDVSIISEIVLGSAYASKTFYIDIRVDAIAYAGNIYKKIDAGETSASDIPVEAYPFGENIPAGWTAWQ